ARQELVGALRGAPPRDERRQRQPRERVARQEPFRGEVAVAVEVGLGLTTRLAAQQLQLRLCLAPQPLGFLAISRRTTSVVDDRGLQVRLLERRAIQPTPPGGRRTETVG